MDDTVSHTFLNAQNMAPLLWAAAALIAGLVFGHWVKLYSIKHRSADASAIGIRWIARLAPLAAPLANMVFLAIGLAIFHAREADMALGLLLTDIAIAWLMVTAIHVLTQSRSKTVLAAVLIIPYLLLSAFGLTGAVADRLSDVSFTIGKLELTGLHVVKFSISAVLLVWLSGALVRGVDFSLARTQNIHGNTRQLFLTIAKTCIYSAAALFALSMLGIDLTAFAVFSGALGVGLGLGLQKIASNFISGLILLTERAINVGDMVEIGDVNGIVRYTSARYTLVEIGDSREVMIPNETFISQPVVNWTFSNPRGLLRMTIPVSYDTDLEKARDLMLQVASENPRVLKDPAPNCILLGYSDTSVNFVLNVWIADIRHKRMTTQSEILMAVWRKFRDNGIGIPHQTRNTLMKTDLATGIKTDGINTEKAE